VVIYSSIQRGKIKICLAKDFKVKYPFYASFICKVELKSSGRSKDMNWKLIVGVILVLVGVIFAIGGLQFLPDIKPVATSILILVAGFGLIGYSYKKGGKMKLEADKLRIVLFIEGALLILIAALLYPKIDWARPADPFGVIILALITAGFVFDNVRKKSQSKIIAVTAAVFILNFMMIGVYESGAFNFIAALYKLFVPFYASFDAHAEIIEYTLIVGTLIFSELMVWKKVKVYDYGKWTLLFLVIQPIMAIFLFEMLGLPAGWLAGTTTRSDLLSTDVNAVLATFGMVFITCATYLIYRRWSFAGALIFSGVWWVVWKSFMLHHPSPEILLASGQSFARAAGFLFFTGIKRMLLPMILIVLVINYRKTRKILASALAPL
jgi:hypothetical protein